MADPSKPADPPEPSLEQLLALEAQNTGKSFWRLKRRSGGKRILPPSLRAKIYAYRLVITRSHPATFRYSLKTRSTQCGRLRRMKL